MNILELLENWRKVCFQAISCNIQGNYTDLVLFIIIRLVLIQACLGDLFAAHIMLLDLEVIEHIKHGYSVAQIASILNSDINPVALKATD